MNNRKNAHGMSRFKNGEQQNKPRDNVRFNTSSKCASKYADDCALRRNIFRNLENNLNDANLSYDSDTDVIYSDFNYGDAESEMESVSGSDDYARRAFDKMETKMNTMTNEFVHNVKSEIDLTFSKLMLQQKKEKSRKHKSQEKGSGDAKKINFIESDNELKNLLKMKKLYYSQISKNLEVLQHIDQLTDKLYKNHVNFVKK
jgi:hypothetical protein